MAKECHIHTIVDLRSEVESLKSQNGMSLLFPSAVPPTGEVWPATSVLPDEEDTTKKGMNEDTTNSDIVQTQEPCPTLPVRKRYFINFAGAKFRKEGAWRPLPLTSKLYQFSFVSLSSFQDL